MSGLIVKRDGAIATVLFSNPEKMNAMTFDMWSAVPKTLGELDADPAIRVIVVAGDGEKAFISGADISQFEKLRGTADAQAEYNKAVEAAYVAPLLCSKPIVARIRGICIGGGLGFAAACDIRIASDNTVFRMPAARLGLGYSATGVKRFMNVLGAANTLDIFVSARKFDAHEAQRMGFVSQVHPVDALEEKVAEYVKMIAENAPLTVKAAKFAVIQGLKDAADRDMEAALKMVQTCFASEDHKEGRKAFMEKRTPNFVGR